jgi:thioredoxin-dependent peroxiredoxin
VPVELSPGDAAPSFDVPDADGNRWRLEDLHGKHVILYFYPADFTGG